ncbi:MAG TPA: ABC transporter ATP-binding protein [Acidimicrobiales bacterium]|nr:ABC transporter ATP-binding protein [Acidimicrobiales bacterium]
MTTAIELRGVGKRFTKYVDTPMLVTAAARFRPRTRRDKLWAIRGVDLEVEDGESVGIIGRNGSGKSTLMTMIGGITAPTEGSVKVWGRVAPLISVGVGFHKELTGRENVYVNGSILGLTRKQIDSRLEAIIDFAEVEEFIDTPVKFYSSGMYVRLGFSVAVHSEPDVLLVDEVLAVGDIGFQVKCFERMQEVRARGTTIVMVSHNLGAIQRMCERVLFVNDGTPQLVASPDEAISAFHRLMSTSTETVVDAGSGKRMEPGVVRIDDIELIGKGGEPTGAVEASDPIVVRVHAHALQDMDDIVVKLLLFGPDGTVVYGDSTADQSLGSVRADSDITCDAAFRATLPTGTYSAMVHLERPDLRTTLFQSSLLSFFVNGRNTVAGQADLEARFTLGSAADRHRHLQSLTNLADGDGRGAGEDVDDLETLFGRTRR